MLIIFGMGTLGGFQLRSAGRKMNKGAGVRESYLTGFSPGTEGGEIQ